MLGGLLVAGLACACSSPADTRSAVSSQPSGATWPDEPSGFTVVNDYGWNALNTPGGWANAAPQDSASGQVSIVQDATAPLSPPNVLQIFYPVGFAGGSAPATEYLTQSFSTQALYVGFWWKASNPWQNHSSGVNKILFIQDDANSNYVLKMLGPPPYHTQVTFEGGSSGNYGENADTTTLTLGQWHKLEMLVDRQGGALKWWMDGKLKGSYVGLTYGGAVFNSTSFSPTWGGTGDTKAENDYYWIDHVHVSER
jgi:hypothetical protein